MNRREFLRTAGVISTAIVLPRAPRLFANSSPAADWRRFVVTSRVEVLKPSGTTRVWLPAALVRETPFQRTISNRVDCAGGHATLVESPQDSLGVVTAQFPAGARPVLTLTSEIATKDYAVNLTAPRHAQLSYADASFYRRPTKLLPTDGIVWETAMEITRGEKTELGRARCIYDWIVDHTFRDPKVRGCGRGNIRAMLETGDLGGKCADLNALYVGLARAAGLPARDVYGIRVAKSKLGLASLGLSTEDASKAQHCRVQVFLCDYVWVPVDPADVRKVVLEEPPGHRPMHDELVRRTRARLFGSWEMNWMAFNFAQDINLPVSEAPAIAFFMYPQAETAEGRLDSLDPESFRYEITARAMDPD